VHDLTDSDLGVLFTGMALDLGPGESTEHLETVMVTESSTNTGTWTAYDDAGSPTTAEDTATVTRGAPTAVSVSDFGATSRSALPLAAAALALFAGIGALALKSRKAS
jgi:hypothetical protein